MEDLMDIDIPLEAMVRLGSKSTARTKCLTVYEQSGGQRLSQTTWSMIDNLKKDGTTIENDLNRMVQSFRDKAGDRNEILQFLEFSDEDYGFYVAFELPEQRDGMTLVDRRGRAISKFYLFDQWVNGRDAGILRGSVSKSCARIWKTDLATRQAHLSRWREEVLQDRVVGIQALTTKYNKIQKSLSILFNERTVSLIKSKRIIGCTTTAAAMHTQALQGASPGVLLVEEAGEILESHTLSALTPNTKQLILIGDHQQLRPKVNSYNLTVQKGDGYDLKGFQDRLIFFNHDHPEVEAFKIAEKRDPEVALSKQNVFEAQMVLKCVRYLGQQGYGTDKLVILTPYLGQLQILLTMLRESNDPVLNDLDSFDLVQAGLMPAASAAISKPKIKLSTIGKSPPNLLMALELMMTC
jgi:hypothetical protein